MRVLRKILYALALFLALCCVFIIICAVRPDITAKVRDTLYPGKEASSADEEGPAAQDAAYVPQDENGGASDDNGDDGEQTDGGGQSDLPQGGQRNGGGDKAGLRSDNTEDYVAPNEADIVVPDEVSGKNGYRQIEGDAQQIGDDDADDIKSRLDYGHTGDGLDFDAAYYPYYAMLDDTGRHVYRQIYANADAVYPTFMPVEDVTSAQLRNIFAAVYNDHPELFWVETAYACKYISTGQCVEIDLAFNRTSQELDSAKAVFGEQAGGVAAGAQGLSDNYAKEKYVHDRLIDRITYNAGAEMNQSAYSALVNGQTVCAGYARAFQYIMQQLGVPCYYCTGYAGESHAWNIISLDDGFYNVDATWDDSGGGNYDYFNKTDADYANSHIRQELSVYLPPCNGQAYRDLERNEASEGEAEAALRSIYDTGVTQDRIFTDMESYYEDCHDRIVQNGIGDYTFYSVVAGEELAEEIMKNYYSGEYAPAYMQQAIDELGAAYCTWEVTPERLQGGMYLLEHEMHVTQ